MSRRFDPAAILALCVLGFLFISVGQPLGVLFARALNPEAISDWLTEPGLWTLLLHTLAAGALVAALTVPLAFLLAFTLEHTRSPLRKVLELAGAAPLLAPSLIPALALVYLFGRQGLLSGLSGGGRIYGLQGIVLADVFAALPHALLILRPALAGQDGRLHEQARMLGAGPFRIFRTVTLPGAAQAALSAGLVVFALTISDVGAPKVVGGDFDVLAVDIFKRVAGQQNFEGGALSALALLAPNLIAAIFERRLATGLAPRVGAGWTPYVPPISRVRDGLAGGASGLIAIAVFGVLATCQFAALARLWPYDLGLTLDHFNLDASDGGGWSAVFNSIEVAGATALVGAALTFLGAYGCERSGRMLGALYGVVALIPAATPGLALGLAYILAFDDPAHPLHVMYGTPIILVVCLTAHFFTAPHLASLARLRSIGADLRAAAAMLDRDGLPFLLGVALPLCAPVLVEVLAYLFVNAMTSVSATVFLYPPDFNLASVAVLNMDDAGDEAAAAAMGMMIVYVNIAAQGLAIVFGGRARLLAGQPDPSGRRQGMARPASAPGT